MLNPANYAPDDRVLILGVPEPAQIAALAVRLEQGLVVAMGQEEDIAEGRRAARAFDNVMFVPLDQPPLPWRDGFFTRAVDLIEGWDDPDLMARELKRVTAPGEQEHHG